MPESRVNFRLLHAQGQWRITWPWLVKQIMIKGHALARVTALAFVSYLFDSDMVLKTVTASASKAVTSFHAHARTPES